MKDMKEVKDEIWILADDRPGNYSQALGLAGEIDFEHKIVNISYGNFAILPNLFLRSSIRGLNKETKKSLSNMSYYPKVIIAAGRRAAPVSLYLKEKSGNRTKIIQIMNPGISHKKFDCIILPRHDRIKKSYTNVIRSIGALTKINNSAIEYEVEKFSKIIKTDKNKKKIALLIGGDSKNTKFDSESAKTLSDRVARIAKNMDAEIFIINSRRTPEKAMKTIIGNLDKKKSSYQFFDFNTTSKKDNPYYALIGMADYFVVTGDSVSMISEVCSLEKSVYIYDNAKISSKKHKKFHKCLLLENYVKELNHTISSLEDVAGKKLDETDRIAKIIKKELF